MAGRRCGQEFLKPWPVSRRIPRAAWCFCRIFSCSHCLRPLRSNQAQDFCLGLRRPRVGSSGLRLLKSVSWILVLMQAWTVCVLAVGSLGPVWRSIKRCSRRYLCKPRSNWLALLLPCCPSSVRLGRMTCAAWWRRATRRGSQLMRLLRHALRWNGRRHRAMPAMPCSQRQLCGMWISSSLCAVCSPMISRPPWLHAGRRYAAKNRCGWICPLLRLANCICMWLKMLKMNLSALSLAH